MSHLVRYPDQQPRGIRYSVKSPAALLASWMLFASPDKALAVASMPSHVLFPQPCPPSICSGVSLLASESPASQNSSLTSPSPHSPQTDQEAVFSPFSLSGAQRQLSRAPGSHHEWWLSSYMTVSPAGAVSKPGRGWFLCSETSDSHCAQV